MDQNVGQRYFFGLFPPPQIREEIARIVPVISQNVSGHLLHPQDWHITLVFIGQVPHNKRGRLLLDLEGQIATPFEIELCQVGYWPHAKVMWLGPKSIPGPMQHLVSMLSNAVSDLKETVENRPYYPHVTLMRQALEPTVIQSIEPIRWQVNEFALAYSMPPGPEGIRYTVQNRWALHSL